MGIIKTRKNTVKKGKKISYNQNKQTPFVALNKKTLTQQELKSLQYYTDGNSLWINNLLSDTNLEQLDEKQKQELQNHVDNLKNIIQKSPPSRKKTIVYRGAEALNDKWKQGKFGEQLLFTSPKRFISTTLSKQKALEFIETDDHCCLLKLILPKGTKGINVTNLSAFKDYGENEIILPPGCEFYIQDKVVKQFDIQGKKIYILVFTALLEKQSG